MSDGFRLRIKYRIDGRLAYLSHLETIRSVERIIRRANLPFAITEGFNPHMKIAFGPALPVGAGSTGEYVDLRLREYVAADRALAVLRANAPESLMPIACEYVELGADAIDVAYPVSVWEAVLDCGGELLSDVQAALDALVKRGYIEVVKKKHGKENVKRVEFEGRLVEPPQPYLKDGRVALGFATYQGEGGALRPDKFIAAALCGIKISPNLMSLVRIDMRTS